MPTISDTDNTFYLQVAVFGRAVFELPGSPSHGGNLIWISSAVFERAVFIFRWWFAPCLFSSALLSEA